MRCLLCVLGSIGFFISPADSATWWEAHPDPATWAHEKLLLGDTLRSEFTKKKPSDIQPGSDEAEQFRLWQWLDWARTDFTPEEALGHHAMLIKQVVRMLCAGVVHGDLSEFNILLAEDGPVIIDLPQAVDAAGNNHAKRMLLRDVDNLRGFFGQFAPELLKTDFGLEIWELYQRGALDNEVALTGRFVRQTGTVDVGGLMREIDDARAEDAARRLRMQSAP